jgi:small neutral amino acid transporter SnatA (MarC family)
VNPVVLAVAMLAVLNPPARAARLRHLDERRSIAAAVVALAVIAAIAAAAGPALDAGDVSAPTVRVGAGLVVGVAGVVDLVRGRGAEPDLPKGWVAALVPAAFPLLLEPQVGVLAVSAGADHGVVVTALTAAAVLAAFITARRIGTSLLVALGRFVGALGVLAGTALVVDGVLSV